MLTRVTPGHETVALLPDKKKHARTYYMGTVTLAGASVFTNSGKVQVVGTVIDEFVEQYPPTHRVRGKMVKYNKSMGYIESPAVYVVGATVWVTKPVEEKTDE
jgi:hypothetical protein